MFLLSLDSKVLVFTRRWNTVRISWVSWRHTLEADCACATLAAAAAAAAWSELISPLWCGGNNGVLLVTSGNGKIQFVSFPSHRHCDTLVARQAFIKAVCIIRICFDFKKLKLRQASVKLGRFSCFRRSCSVSISLIINQFPGPNNAMIVGRETSSWWPLPTFKSLNFFVLWRVWNTLQMMS